jgi:glycerol uptake facilitator-like aquaporin
MRHSQYKRIRNILIELFGTMVIVYFTNWANLLYELEQVGLSTLAMIYGMMVASMIYIGQDRSGGHFDPSVTVSAVDAAVVPLLQQGRLFRGDPVHARAAARWFDRR